MNPSLSVSEEQPWYSALREQWRPEHVRLLLVGESAPNDGGDISKRHFFYASELTASDALFRSVVHVCTTNRTWTAGADRKIRGLRGCGMTVCF